MEPGPGLDPPGCAGEVAAQPQGSHGNAREGSAACTECGNSAKKDCQYHRCRTCCKARGFLCPTHIKSTWVPAAKRRERQAAEAEAAVATGTLLPEKNKRQKSTASSTPSTSTSGGGIGVDELAVAAQAHAIASKLPLPAEVTAQTLLKSVCLTGVEDGVFEFGYHATVKVGGHIFKGVLYNAGIDPNNPPAHPLQQQQLQLHQPPPSHHSSNNGEMSAVVSMNSRPIASLGLLDSALYGPSSSLMGVDSKVHAVQDLFHGPSLGSLGL
eukprot:jgi/Mesen1/11020/ME000098S10416